MDQFPFVALVDPIGSDAPYRPAAFLEGLVSFHRSPFVPKEEDKGAEEKHKAKKNPFDRATKARHP
ncbi:MAG: hypothetical protein HQL31_12595 [Planctomycetes bacterium]|nr:hypothetical protein [Planctomycetota bacterium]